MKAKVSYPKVDVRYILIAVLDLPESHVAPSNLGEEIGEITMVIVYQMLFCDRRIEEVHPRVVDAHLRPLNLQEHTVFV